MRTWQILAGTAMAAALGGAALAANPPIIGKWEAIDSCDTGGKLEFTANQQTITTVSPLDHKPYTHSIPVHYVDAKDGKWYVMGTAAQAGVWIVISANEIKNGNYPSCHYRRVK